MKLWTFLFLILLPSISFSQSALINSNGKPGTITSCTVDSDVDVAFSTTVAVDAAAGQKVIGLTAVTNLVAGDTILIDADNSGKRKELCVVASIATLDVTCVDNLVYAHTAAQADDVVLTNRIGPLGEGNNYLVQLVTSGDVAQAGRWIMGDEFVNAETSYGVTTTGSVGLIGTQVKAVSGTTYISFKTATANAVGKACLIR